jgi:hypothetical protein
MEQEGRKGRREKGYQGKEKSKKRLRTREGSRTN